MADDRRLKAEARGGGWDRFEQVARVLSLAAIPVAVALGGWWIQERLAAQNVSRDYVQLAVSILRDRELGKSEDATSLRAWAVDLLNANSPVKLSGAVVERLKRGEVSFPLSGISVPADRVAVSPDGSLVATIESDNSITIRDVRQQRQVARLGGGAQGALPTTVVFSPDSTKLAVASITAVAVWEVRTGRRVASWRTERDILAMSFTSDGRRILAMTSDLGVLGFDVQ